MAALVPLTASFAAGALAGALFFWGLWATVNRLGAGSRGGAWMLASFGLRFGFLLAGFFLLARYAGWEHVLSAVVGFTLSRILFVRRLRPGSAGGAPRP